MNKNQLYMESREMKTGEKGKVMVGMIFFLIIIMSLLNINAGMNDSLFAYFILLLSISGLAGIIFSFE